MHSKSLVGLLLMLTVLLAQTPTTNGAKILAVYTFPARSHYMMHSALIRELLNNGHEVTMITARTLKPLELGHNYTEILIEPTFDFWQHFHEVTGTNSIYDLANDLSALLKMTIIFGLSTTEHALKQPNVQAVINAKQTKGVYDLLLVEQFLQDAFLALAHIYDIPVISTASFGQRNYMSQMFGIMSPWSYVPAGFLPITDQMNFWERIQNSYQSIKMDLEREINYYPEMDRLVQKYFGQLSIDFPSTSVMSRNLSAMLINSYKPVALPGPKIDGMINVGGMHIYPNKTLPNDIQKFIDEAEHGVIYFSLGTQVQSKDLPLQKLKIFVDVFRNLKQRVLWKYESSNLKNVPSNIMIKAWMPQSDILAHPNVRIFIAHGGLFGTLEAVHYGVPIVGVPFYTDQYLNVKKGELSGYAVSLDIHTLTPDDLSSALHKVLYNETYRENMKRMSKIFHDRPMGSRETAMYWIDYVIRHKGARHMRAAGLDLKWYQFYLLDVIAFFLAAAAVLFGVIVLLVCWTCRRLKRVNGKEKIE